MVFAGLGDQDGAVRPIEFEALLYFIKNWLALHTEDKVKTIVSIIIPFSAFAVAVLTFRCLLFQLLNCSHLLVPNPKLTGGGVGEDYAAV